MRNFEGTKGKFKVWKDQLDNNNPIIGSEEGIPLFIVAKSSLTSPYHYHANAKLLATAPEMFELLFELRNGFDGWDALPPKIQNRIHLLIKKATDIDT